MAEEPVGYLRPRRLFGINPRRPDLATRPKPVIVPIPRLAAERERRAD